MMQQATTPSTSTPIDCKPSQHVTFQFRNLAFAIATMAMLLVAASYGEDTLEAKLHIQGQGIGKILDVGSHYCIIAYHLFAFHRYFRDPLAPVLVKTGLIFSFAFNILAIEFHSQREYIPSPWIADSILAIGSMVLMCYTLGLAPVVGMEDGSINFAMTQFAVLLATTVGDFVVNKGGSKVYMRFGLNAWVFTYVGIALCPLLQTLYKKTGLQQAVFMNLAFPGMALAMILEGYVEKYLHLDSHVFVHIFVLMFVAAMNEALCTLNKYGACQIQSKVQKIL